MTARFRIGIDLGGTKIEAAAVDHVGAVRIRRRIATPTGNYRATIEAIAAFVAAIGQQIGETASVGIGMPGTISPITGLVKNANPLANWPLLQQSRVHARAPFHLANDANCRLYRKQPTAPRAWRPFWRRPALGWEGIARENILVGANAIAGEWATTHCPGAAG
jgi:fructokinase